MTIGQRIKKVLDNQGMTQKELAEKSGITEVAISRYVHDERIPQTLILIDICDTLHVSSDYLLGIRYWGLKEKENEVTELAKLPPVTPKPKKGHWELVQRGKSIDVCCSNCKAVRIKRYAYGYTIDQLDKEYVKERFESDDMRYCPHCGNEIEVTE